MTETGRRRPGTWNAMYLRRKDRKMQGKWYGVVAIVLALVVVVLVIAVVGNEAGGQYSTPTSREKQKGGVIGQWMSKEPSGPARSPATRSIPLPPKVIPKLTLTARLERLEARIEAIQTVLVKFIPSLQTQVDAVPSHTRGLETKLWALSRITTFQRELITSLERRVQVLEHTVTGLQGSVRALGKAAARRVR